MLFSSGGVYVFNIRNSCSYLVISKAYLPFMTINYMYNINCLASIYIHLVTYDFVVWFESTLAVASMARNMKNMTLINEYASLRVSTLICTTLYLYSNCTREKALLYTNGSSINDVIHSFSLVCIFQIYITTTTCHIYAY